MNYSEFIKQTRLEDGMTQKELSVKSGVRIATISNIENGIGNPTLKTFEKIAKVLDLQINEVLLDKKED